MTQPPPDPSTRNLLLLEFPVRLYTALRTVRLYPATNPQVLRSIDLVERAFRDLLATTGADRGEIAVVEQQLLVCGEPLADRDQVRPQIVGLSHLFQRLQIHFATISAKELLYVFDKSSQDRQRHSVWGYLVSRRLVVQANEKGLCVHPAILGTYRAVRTSHQNQLAHGSCERLRP